MMLINILINKVNKWDDTVAISVNNLLGVYFNSCKCFKLIIYKVHVCNFMIIDNCAQVP